MISCVVFFDSRVTTAVYDDTHQQQVRRQDLAAGGAKNQKEGPKTRRGATFLKYSIGCMQKQGGQTRNGGHRFQMGGRPA